MGNNYLYGQPPMQPPQNVPMAGVDSQFSIPSMQQLQQQPDQYAHASDVLSQYLQSKQQQQSGNGLTEQILAGRFQPQMQDVQRSITQTAQAYGAPDLFKAVNPYEAADARAQSELSPYTYMAGLQNKASTNMMNMAGGGTGVLANRLMQENPGMTFQQALFAVQGGMNKGLQMGPDGVTPIQGAPQAVGAMKFGENYGGQQGKNTSDLSYAGPLATAKTGAEEATKAQYAGQIAQNTEAGKNRAENAQQAVSTKDIVGLYQKLKDDAATAPSGMVMSGIARGANMLNMPTTGAVAQATFDADLNNLYLATIRSLKGTGRVMEQELVKIGEAAPKATDSREVKIAKANAHMAYYQDRMRELGFDPGTGAPLGGGAQIQPMNESQFNMPSSGGNPLPPSPDQLQMGFAPGNLNGGGGGSSGGASHRYNPVTGGLDPIQ
jgi:hypothetical protein